MTPQGKIAIDQFDRPSRLISDVLLPPPAALIASPIVGRRYYPFIFACSKLSKIENRSDRFVIVKISCKSERRWTRARRP